MATIFFIGLWYTFAVLWSALWLYTYLKGEQNTDILAAFIASLAMARVSELKRRK